jgi:fatty acid desaturase
MSTATHKDILAAATEESTKPFFIGGYKKIHPKLWVIHGQYYDLTEWIPKHPGGSETLNLARGRDCTELFESVHALSTQNIHALLQKYKVDTPEGYEAPQDLFTWEKNGFYDVVKKRVKEHFANRKYDHKATVLCWLKIALIAFLWLSIAYVALATGSLALLVLSGCFNAMLGFCGMHEASHYALSKRPWVNRSIHTVWNNLNLWPHFVWLRHHVYGHHSYTGVWRQDPDLVNTSNYIRKHPCSPYTKMHETQYVHAWLLLGFAPNQHLGQTVMYLRSIVKKSIFGVPYIGVNWEDFLVSFPLLALSLYMHFIFPFSFGHSTAYTVVLLFTYMTTLGIGYMTNVAPNHDTIDTHHSALMTGEKRDWGIQQVLATGNHSTEGLTAKIVSNLWGSMNFQIEHHLFPTVCHIHQYDVSKIVQKTCKEFNIKYVTHSWPTALWRHGELLWLMSFSQTLAKPTRPGAEQKVPHKQD